MSVSLYLSQLKLNPTNWAVQADIENRYRLHHRVCQAFAGYSREENRVLWRFEATREGPQLLVQSQKEPDWERLETPKKYFRTSPMVKRISVSLLPDQQLRFRLDANPTHRNRFSWLKGETGKSTLTTPIVDSQRIEWLGSQFEKTGFQLLAGVERDSQFLKMQKDHQNMTLLCSWFEGLVSVNDPGLAEKGLISGIGRGKAFGLGMLSLAAPA